MWYGPYKRLPQTHLTTMIVLTKYSEKKNMFLPDSQVVATGCYLDLEPERSREEDDLDWQGDRDLQILSTWGKFHSKNSWEN